jgi:hypothetical protein
MKAMELYELLNNAGVKFEVVEIMDGLRVINVIVDEFTDEEINNAIADVQGDI